MRIKRIISVVFALIIGLTMGKLLVMALTPPVLPVGADAPRFEFRNDQGEKVVFQSRDFDMIMIFSTTCEHCVYQLELLNANLDTLAPATLYLITAEADYRQSNEFSNLKELNTSTRVSWGTVNTGTIREHFGNTSTPAFYIFRNGRLKSKFYGEVKLERLLEMLEI